MFTGIIESLGTVESVQDVGGDVRLRIHTDLDMSDIHLGDSIATNGICLTVIDWGHNWYAADVSRESLHRTTLSSWQTGQRVNVEKAMLPTTRFGGHIVSGHVDGIGQVIEKIADGRSFRFKFKAPDNLAKYIAEKGSICINGISLTVNEVKGAVFGVNIVPHTLKETTLGDAVAGTQVNLEVDLLARYMERLMQGEAAAKDHGGITEELLQKSGFLGK